MTGRLFDYAGMRLLLIDGRTLALAAAITWAIFGAGFVLGAAWVAQGGGQWYGQLRARWSVAAWKRRQAKAEKRHAARRIA